MTRTCLTFKSTLVVLFLGQWLWRRSRDWTNGQTDKRTNERKLVTISEAQEHWLFFIFYFGQTSTSLSLFLRHKSTKRMTIFYFLFLTPQASSHAEAGITSKVLNFADISLWFSAPPFFVQVPFSSDTDTGLWASKACHEQKHMEQ